MRLSGSNSPNRRLLRTHPDERPPSGATQSEVAATIHVRVRTTPARVASSPGAARQSGDCGWEQHPGRLCRQHSEGGRLVPDSLTPQASDRHERSAIQREAMFCIRIFAPRKFEERGCRYNHPVMDRHSDKSARSPARPLVLLGSGDMRALCDDLHSPHRNLPTASWAPMCRRWRRGSA